MRRDISKNIEMQGCAPMDPACAGIKLTGLWAMNRALAEWEKRRGLTRPKYGRSGFSEKRPKFTEPKPATAPRPPRARKPAAPRARKYDPTVPRSQRPQWKAYKARYRAEHPPTEEQRRANAERCRQYRAKLTPEQKAAEVARVRAWKLARKQC